MESILTLPLKVSAMGLQFRLIGFLVAKFASVEETPEVCGYHALIVVIV